MQDLWTPSFPIGHFVLRGSVIYIAVLMLVLVGAPGGEHAAGEPEAPLAEGLLLGQPFAMAAEVAVDVRPAHLAPVGFQVLKPVPAI